MDNNNWSRDELMLAFNLYCKTEFEQIQNHNTGIVALSRLMGRTPNDVTMKMISLACSDPTIKAGELSDIGSPGRSERLMFAQFQKNREELAFESELILAKFENQTIEKKFQNLLKGIYKLTGEERRSYIKTRVNQNFFREMIRANYLGRCAVTGIDIPQLITATHIIPWARNEKERLNPENGICLSSLYDQAFTRGLIGFDDDYRLILSPTLRDYTTRNYYRDQFGRLEGQEMLHPIKAEPRKEFLQWHREKVMG